MAGRTTDAKAHAESEKARELRQQQIRADLMILAKQPAFMRFYGYLLHETRFMGRCFDLNGSTTNFNLGRRELGIEFLVLIESVQPDALLEIRRAMKALEEENA